MLKQFKDEIPEIEKLISVIKKMISDPESSLEDIREAVCDHIVEESSLDPPGSGYDDMFFGAINISFNVIDDLIYDLDVSEINFNRILAYLSTDNKLLLIPNSKVEIIFMPHNNLFGDLGYTKTNSLITYLNNSFYETSVKIFDMEKYSILIHPKSKYLEHDNFPPLKKHFTVSIKEVEEMFKKIINSDYFMDYYSSDINVIFNDLKYAFNLK